MCRRRRWWLALNNDDKAPDSPFDPSRFRTNPSIHPYSHLSIRLLSLSLGGLIIDLLSAFLGLCRTGKREIVTDTQNGQQTEMYLGVRFCISGDYADTFLKRTLQHF